MFDKELFSLLLSKALGDRTTTEYSSQSGVNRTYISKFLNKKMDNPPSPEILKGLADSSQNRVTYTQLMQAAGYIDNDLDLEDISNPVEELLAKPKFAKIYDIEEAMKVLLAQPGLMLKGEVLEDEDKIILANAIQMGLKFAEDMKDKKNKDNGK